jgi:methylglutamate dehydrogenase subunit D
LRTEPRLTMHSPLIEVAKPGRFGRPTLLPGVSIEQRGGLVLAVIISRNGQQSALADIIRETFAAALPHTRKLAHGNTLDFVWTAPRQWLAIGERAKNPDLLSKLRTGLSTTAAVFDESDARVILRVHGPRIRDTLSKLISIDLHRRAFHTGDAASTHAAGIVVQLWQVDNRPAYNLVVARSYAADFWERLVEAGSEYGIEVV